MLYKLHASNKSYRIYARALIMENKFRASRYGIEGKLIDFGKEEEVPVRDLMLEYLDLIDEAVEELGSRKENQVHSRDAADGHRRRSPVEGLCRDRRPEESSRLHRRRNSRRRVRTRSEQVRRCVGSNGNRRVSRCSPTGNAGCPHSSRFPALSWRYSYTRPSI